MLSEVVGATEPLSERCISEMLAMTARRVPEKVALISLHQGLRINWQQAQQHVEMLAGGLFSMGLRPKDRIGVWAWNCAEWIYLQFAAARIGVVLVNVNPALGESDLAFVLSHAKIRALFIQQADDRKDYADLLERSGEARSLEHVIVLGSRRWQELATCTAPLPLLTTSPDDVVNVQYTSGSTGNPKGVLLTHRNVVNNALVLARALKIRDDDVLCAQVPMHHCFGYVVSSLLCAATGMSLVFPAARFSPRATLQAISKEHCTVIHGVPTMFSACLQHPEFRDADLRSLRTGIMAGAPCPVELVKRVMSEMKCGQMTIAYGQTETSPAVTISDADADPELRSETVGRVLPNTEIRVVNSDGIPVPIGDVGEIVVRGAYVMRGYDGDAAGTARAVDAQGWLRTGDLASMRSDGYLSIKGRLTDMIIRGGENVYPKEIEDVLSSHPMVAECCVVGVPDELFGEAVLSWVRARSGCQLDPKELAVFCTRKLASFKVPGHIRSVDEFPLTSNGKIDRKRIQQLEVEAQGLERLVHLRTA